MSRQNPGNGIAPAVVLECAKTLEVKLGRPSYVRQVKNREEWFFTDPMFSFVQHGLRKGITGYRVGYFYSAEEDELGFFLVHSPVMAQLFKKNLHISALIKAATGCAPFCQAMRMFWDSRMAKRKGERGFGIEDTPTEFFVIP